MSTMSSLRLAPIVIAILVLSFDARAEEAEHEKVLFEDNFATQLGQGWSWVRENREAWRIEAGWLEIKTLPGYLHAGSNNSKNVLLRTPPAEAAESLAFEVLLENEPTVQYEHAGLLYYQDDDNYIGLFKENLGGKVEIQMVMEHAGKPKFAVKPYPDKSVWLRLQRIEGTVVGQFRATENDDWQPVGQDNVPPAGQPKVGLIAGGGPEKSDRWARFRQFKIVLPK